MARVDRGNREPEATTKLCTQPKMVPPSRSLALQDILSVCQLTSFQDNLFSNDQTGLTFLHEI